jgi:hypothetical protein
MPTPNEFIAARNRSTRSAFLSHLEPSDILSHTLILSRDKKIGAAVSPEGDIQNVFNNGGKKGGAADIMLEAVHSGGITLDAFSGFLPGYYHNFGFNETGRVKFNREYAPKNWDYDKYGEPDIVFMARTENITDAESKQRLANWQHTRQQPQSTGRYFDDWDTGKADSRRIVNGEGYGSVIKPFNDRTRDTISGGRVQSNDRGVDEFDAANKKLQAGIKNKLPYEYVDNVEDRLGEINKEQYTSWAQKLTLNEQQAIKDYVGSSFSFSLNEDLRSEAVEMSDRNVRVKRDLTSALSKASFPQDILLYRGVIDTYNKMSTKFNDNLGKIFTDKGFVSTTAYAGYLGPQMAEFPEGSLGAIIKIHKGAHAASVDPYNSTKKEWEVLIQRNSRFRVLKFDGKIAYLELVP